MKKGIFSIICLFFGMTVFAQDITNDELFLRYEAEVKRLSTSESYLNYSKINKEYYDKINNNQLFIDAPEFIEDQFEKHLKDTKFATTDEAMELYKKQQEVQDIFYNDIKKSSNLLSELQKKYEARLIFETYDLRNNSF